MFSNINQNTRAITARNTLNDWYLLIGIYMTSILIVKLPHIILNQSKCKTSSTQEYTPIHIQRENHRYISFMQIWWNSNTFDRIITKQLKNIVELC